MASVAAHSHPRLWHYRSHSILPCFLDLSGDESYVRLRPPIFPPPTQTSVEETLPGSHLVALSFVLIEGLSRQLDSSHEKLLDSIVSVSPSVSPAVSPSYLDVNLPGKHPSTAASSNSNHYSACEASDTVDDSCNAGVLVEEHETLPTPSKHLLAHKLGSASSDNAMTLLQRTQMSSPFAKYLNSVHLAATEEGASTTMQCLVSNEKAGERTAEPITDAATPTSSFANRSTSISIDYFTSKYPGRKRTLMYDHHDSSEENTDSGGTELTASFTVPSYEWICDLASDILVSWKTHTKNCRSVHMGLVACAGNDLPLSDVSGKRTDGNQKTPPTSRNTKKRHRPSDGEGDSEGDNEDRPWKRRSKAPPLSLHRDTAAVRLLACPFYKNDPTRFSVLNNVERGYRGCSTRYLPDIGRLKQHLHRNHGRPPNYCGRCYEAFPTRTILDLHTNQSVRCQAAEPRYSECMTAEQALDIRKKHPLLSIEENWYRIWRILFPDTMPPDSPYVESAMDESITSFLAYFRQQAPTRIRTSLQAAGIVPDLGIERATTDRVLEEAISQILVDYHATQDQSGSAPQNPRPDFHRDHGGSSESTRPDRSSSDFMESWDPLISTNPVLRPTQPVSQPILPTTSLTPSGSLVSLRLYHSGEGHTHPSRTLQATSTLVPDALPDYMSHWDPNNAAFWTFRPGQIDGTYPTLGIEPPPWEWEDTLA